MRHSPLLDLLPVREEELSPQDFIELTQENPSVIASSRIKMPRLGEAGFGCIHVEYTRPIYKANFKAIRR